MSLDSDIPNPDANLQVTFYTYEGEGMWKGVPHVRIITPGDKTNIPDRPAREDDKRRFQREWLHFQMKENADLVVGTPLLTWREERPDDLTDGQLQELLILKFLSVEQVAMSSDSQCAKIGMGAMGLRERAKRYLAGKNAQASGQEIADLKAMVAQLATQLAAQAAPAPAPTKPAPARKVAWNKGKKRSTIMKAPADVHHDDAAAGAAVR
jgi:hypothetical protein